MNKITLLLTPLLLSSCLVFEQIDKLPEPAVHAIMIPITIGLPLLLVP
jgi:hypothetical protein